MVRPGVTKNSTRTSKPQRKNSYIKIDGLHLCDITMTHDAALLYHIDGSIIRSLSNLT